VPYLDAILGSEAVVKTIDGDVTIKVPSGSQPDTILRLRNRGAPKLNQRDNRGSHFVTLKVNIPTAVTASEKILLEQLRNYQK
jgi:molecular chaperone DnaJ